MVIVILEELVKNYHLEKFLFRIAYALQIIQETYVKYGLLIYARQENT